MLDDRLVEIGVVDLAAQRRVENLLLQHGVDLELGADLVRELFLRSVARRLLELREKPLHLAVVVDEQMGCVLLVLTGHLCLLISLWEHSERAAGPVSPGLEERKKGSEECRVGKEGVSTCRSG